MFLLFEERTSLVSCPYVRNCVRTLLRPCPRQPSVKLPPPPPRRFSNGFFLHNSNISPFSNFPHRPPSPHNSISDKNRSPFLWIPWVLRQHLFWSVLALLFYSQISGKQRQLSLHCDSPKYVILSRTLTAVSRKTGKFPSQEIKGIKKAGCD